MTTQQKRFHELDWLRVILIFAVFLHHVGMPFNGDGFHIMNAQSSKVLDDIMVYFEQFRLPLLFLIAGCSSVLFLNAKDNRRFVKRRVLRLLVPLIFAVLVIVPPQNYIEHIDKYDSYLSAWPELALQLQTNHLWFIQFLLIFAILSMVIHRLMKGPFGQVLQGLLERLGGMRFGLLAIALLVGISKVCFNIYFPENSESLGFLSNMLFYGLFYLSGMWLIGSDRLWSSIKVHRRINLSALVLASVLFYGYYYSPDLSDYLSLQQRWAIWWFISAVVSWTGALALLGYAQQYLNHEKRGLSVANTMAYPFYILHQTVIVVLAYPIVQWQAGIWVKMTCLLAGSLFITLLSCALFVYPFNTTRMLLGVRAKQPRQDHQSVSGPKCA